MNRPLMPRSTALWLLRNTKLSMGQISKFCSISVFDLDAMKKGFVESLLKESNPILMRQLTKEEIERCESDSKMELQLKVDVEIKRASKIKVPHVLKKHIPKCVLWMRNNYNFLTERKIANFFNVKEEYVNSIIESSNKHSEDVNPTLIGICSTNYMEEFLKKNKKDELND